MPSDAPATTARARRAGFWLSILAIALIGWFYVWTASPGGMNRLFLPDRASYYNLLVRGFLKGHLSLDVASDPLLSAMADPYNPVGRTAQGFHDASYFRGKFYLYFGVTPVLILFLPFHVLTGSDLAESLAVVIFSLLGLVVGWALLRAIIREYFPRTPVWLEMLAVFALGLGNMVPPLLRRPTLWEVPISGAYAMYMVTLYLVWRAVAGKAAYFWAAAASLAMGLTVGARPVYLIGSVVLIVPWLWLARQVGRGFWRRDECRKLAGAILGPISAFGLGLGLYNYERFGNPMEFGQAYQMAGAEVSKMTLFSPSYFLFNLRVYLFSCPGLSPYFPFLTVITPPPSPQGHLGVENPYGIVTSMPWVLFAGVTVWLALRQGGRLGLWCGGVLASVILTLATVCGFAGATGRYEVDFTPGFVLLAAVGVAWLAHELAGRRWRSGALVLAAVLALWSIGFNVLISLQHNRLLMINYPGTYARLAKGFNYIPYWLGKLTAEQDGPVEMRVVFPQNATGNVEPLGATGREFLSDYVFVHYLSKDHVRFGFEHTSRGSWTGQPVPIAYEAEHVVVVQMGSLYPPRAHPIYDGMAPEQIDADTRTVKVLLDGHVALSVKAECYDAAQWQPSIGASGIHRPGFKRDFSGRLLGWRHVPPFPPDRRPNAYGALHLSLMLPNFTKQRSDPILSSGAPGKGDLLYIAYLDERHFVLGHDCWGYGGAKSSPVEYDPARPVNLDISCPPLEAPGTAKRLRISREGQVIMDVEDRFYPSAPSDISVGINRIGASSAGESFTGEIQPQNQMNE